MKSLKNITADLNQESGQNPLDTTFGSHSRRAEALRTQTQGGILDFADSALKHLKLSTVSNLGKIAERFPQALRYFPKDSTLVVSASGDCGDYESSGWLSVCCELKYPGLNGQSKFSGREEIHRSTTFSANGPAVERAFERFLQLLENKSLDNG